MTTNIDLMLQFIAAWEAKDVEGIVARMTPDAHYVNVGMSDSRGRDAIRAMLIPFVGGADQIRWTVHHIAQSADGAVFTERTDVFVMGPKTLTVPVTGICEFRSGLISAWRDYFDLPGFQAQMV